MAPRRRTPTDYGDPADEPDFDFVTMADRVKAFLRDGRDTRRGGFGIAHGTLLFRRLRSAIRSLNRGVINWPNMPPELFAYAWDFFRDMVKEMMRLKLIPDNSPLRAWLERARGYEEIDAKKGNPNNARLRCFLAENGWPEEQVVPPAEVAGKGNGPMQWWRVFEQGRALNLANIDRWQSARRKHNERRRKKGLPEDSDSDPVDDEDNESPPPKAKARPKPKSARSEPKKAPASKGPSKTAGPTAKAPAQAPSKQRVASNVSTLSQIMDQDSASVVDARHRTRRNAAVTAEEEAYEDVTAVGPDAGDFEEDRTYAGATDDASDTGNGSRRRKRATSRVTPKQERSSEDVEEDQLASDDTGTAQARPPPSTRGTTARTSAKNGGARSRGRTDDEEEGEDFWKRPSMRKTLKRKLSRKTSPSEDSGDELPARSRSRKPSWSAAETKAKSAFASGSKGKTRGKSHVEFEDEVDISDHDNHRGARPTSEPGPSAPQPRRQPQGEFIELFNTSSEDDESGEESERERDDMDVDMADAEDGGKSKGKGKAKAPPRKRRRKNRAEETPVMTRGGPVIIPGNEARREVPARREVEPATDEDLVRAHSGVTHMDVDPPRPCPRPELYERPRHPSSQPVLARGPSTEHAALTAPPPQNPFESMAAMMNMLTNGMMMHAWGQQHPGTEIPPAFLHAPIGSSYARPPAAVPLAPNGVQTQTTSSHDPPSAPTQTLPQPRSATPPSATPPSATPPSANPPSGTPSPDSLRAVMERLDKQTGAGMANLTNEMARLGKDFRDEKEKHTKLLQGMESKRDEQGQKLDSIQKKQDELGQTLALQSKQVADVTAGQAALASGHTDLNRRFVELAAQVAKLEEKEKRKREQRTKKKDHAGGDVEMTDDTPAAQTKERQPSVRPQSEAEAATGTTTVTAGTSSANVVTASAASSMALPPAAPSPCVPGSASPAPNAGQTAGSPAILAPAEYSPIAGANSSVLEDRQGQSADGGSQDTTRVLGLFASSRVGGETIMASADGGAPGADVAAMSAPPAAPVSSPLSSLSTPASPEAPAGTAAPQAPAGTAAPQAPAGTAAPTSSAGDKPIGSDDAGPENSSQVQPELAGVGEVTSPPVARSDDAGSAIEEGEIAEEDTLMQHVTLPAAGAKRKVPSNGDGSQAKKRSRGNNLLRGLQPMDDVIPTPDSAPGTHNLRRRGGG